MKRFNMSLDTDPQQQEAASPQVLRSGQLRRWAALNQKPDSVPGGRFRPEARLRAGE